MDTEVININHLEAVVCHLLEHDLVGALDKVLPNRFSNVSVAVDEVVRPEHVHRRHIVDGGELLRQKGVAIQEFRMAENMLSVRYP